MPCERTPPLLADAGKVAAEDAADPTAVPAKVVDAEPDALDAGTLDADPVTVAALDTVAADDAD